jgi:hypothetical protein
MANHEPRERRDHVDLFLAFARPKDGVVNRKCIRTIIKDYEQDLAILEAKLKIIGGIWRIHKTTNSRDTVKAMKWLQHKLLDNPEFAGCIDSIWRTALLQPECIYGEKWFLLDVDTKNKEALDELDFRMYLSFAVVLETIETPAGWHYITRPFDTRWVCNLMFVSLKRDGYSFVKRVGE